MTILLAVGNNSGGINVNLEAGEDSDVRLYEVGDDSNGSGNSGDNEGRRNHVGGDQVVAMAESLSSRQLSLVMYKMLSTAIQRTKALSTGS